MNLRIQNWLGQVTTGHGVMVLVPTLMGAISGTITWDTAVPLLVAGVTGLVWPESAAAGTAAQSLTKDVQALIAAYRTGLDHAGATPVMATSVPAVPAHGATAAGIAALAMGAAALVGCANQTATQTQADLVAVASGLICVADASGKVIAVTSASDANAVKATNAAIAAGGSLTTDSACQTAVTNGAAALAAQPATPAATQP